MTRKGAALAGFLFLLAGQLGAESVLPDLSNCRGLNYVVGESKNPTDQWLNYEPDVVADNLDILAAFGVNAVRVFGNMDVWRHYDSLGQSTYEDRVKDLVQKAYDRDILVMLILFDSASIGSDPGDVTQNAASGWWKTPGDAYVEAGWEANQTEIAHYIGDTMAAVQAAGAGQVIYDVWNEPKIPDAEHVILALETVKAIDPQARTTVGHAGAKGNATLFAMAPLTMLETPVEDNVDVLSHHPYGIFEDHVVNQVGQVAVHGKPHVASEAGNHGRGQSYMHVIDWLSGAGEGFFLWEAFASETPFTGVTGLFYSRDNPTAPLPNNVAVRDLEAVNKLLAMAVDRGHNPSKIAKLRATSHSGYIAYYPTTYGFTTSNAYDLLLSWDLRYGAETYSQTPLAGYLSTPQTIQPVDFYDTILGWTKTGLKKLGTLTNEQEEDYDTCRTDLWAALTAIANATNFVTIGPPQTLSLFDDVDDAFSCMASNVALGTSQHAPVDLNTAPEIAYIKTSLSSVPLSSGPPLSNQFELTVEMVINDADRLFDIADADIKFSSDGISFTTLNPTWWTARGYLKATFVMPPMQAGQPYLVMGRVEDDSGAWVEEVVPVAPSPP